MDATAEHDSDSADEGWTLRVPQKDEKSDKGWRCMTSSFSFFFSFR